MPTFVGNTRWVKNRRCDSTSTNADPMSSTWPLMKRVLTDVATRLLRQASNAQTLHSAAHATSTAMRGGLIARCRAPGSTNARSRVYAWRGRVDQTTRYGSSHLAG